MQSMYENYELMHVKMHVATETKYNCSAHSTVINISNLFTILTCPYFMKSISN